MVVVTNHETDETRWSARPEALKPSKAVAKAKSHVKVKCTDGRVKGDDGGARSLAAHASVRDSCHRVAKVVDVQDSDAPRSKKLDGEVKVK